MLSTARSPTLFVTMTWSPEASILSSPETLGAALDGVCFPAASRCFYVPSANVVLLVKLQMCADERDTCIRADLDKGHSQQATRVFLGPGTEKDS